MATKLGLDAATAHREFAAFCDYWRARPGPGATKCDWDSTWRNWCRRRTNFAPPAADAVRLGQMTFKQRDEEAGRERAKLGGDVMFKALWGDAQDYIDTTAEEIEA